MAKNKLKKPIIALDLDDVLTPHHEGLIGWYNQQYGTHLTLAEVHSSDPKPWGTDTDEAAIKRVHAYFDSDQFMQEQPYNEVTSALYMLKQSYDLVVITGRDELIKDHTNQWLEKHFPEVFRSAHFTSQYSLEGKSRSKLEVMKAEGASYLVDDNADAVIEVVNAGLHGVLFGDYPWNRVDGLPTNLTRCKDWNAVLEYFDAQR